MKPGPKPDPNLPPSVRHRDILQCMADGKPDKRIASELGIKLATVKSHSAILRTRIGATDRAHAVAIAIRRGWIQ